MAKKLFVGGLSWGTTDETLRAGFERFGPVSDAKVVTDRETGRSRGFGFVSFNEDAHADAAIQEMDGSTFESRTINVSEARERPARGGGFGGGGGGRGGYGGGGGSGGGGGAYGGGGGGRGGGRGGGGGRGKRRDDGGDGW
jgi:RNA recognition motif-containing protein